VFARHGFLSRFSSDSWALMKTSAQIGTKIDDFFQQKIFTGKA
jgi:hypothetical protein